MAHIKKIARRKGVVYKAEVCLSDGMKKAMSFRTKADAEQWARGQEDVKAQQKHSGVVQVRMSMNDYFEQWFDEYARQYHSPGWQITDQQIFRDYVRPILGPRLIRDINAVDIQRVLREMTRKGLAPSYANRVRQLLNKMFNEAVNTYRYLSANPVAGVRPFREIPKAITVLNREESLRLLKWAECDGLGLGLDLALQLGLREGEVIGLKWDALDLEQRTFKVKRKWEKKVGVLEDFAKGGKHRELGIYPDGLLLRLRRQRSLFPTAEFVVCQPDGAMITPMRLINVLRRGIRATGIPKVTIHGLRHTFASLYMQSGGGLYDLQRIMGHSSVSTTERYRHTDPEYLRRKCDVLDLYGGNSVQTPPTDERPGLRLVELGS